MTKIERLASLIDAYKRCILNKNEFANIHLEAINHIEKSLPSGSGIDAGCRIDLLKSTAKKVFINTSYHFMEEGWYADWKDYTIVITPSFSGIDIDVKGQNKDDIKDYLAEMFDENLCEEWADTRELAKVS